MLQDVLENNILKACLTMEHEDNRRQVKQAITENS